MTKLTLVYSRLSSEYSNLGEWYLAMFARTPHPFSSTGAYTDPSTGEIVRADAIPDYIPKSNIVRDPMNESDLLSSLQGPGKLNRSQENKASRLTNRQIQAAQRKALLRPQAIRGDSKNPTFPLMNNSDVLKEAQTTLAKPEIRQVNNDIALVDRHKRSIANQLLDREKALPPIDEKRLAEAQQRLQSLPDSSWDLLTNVNKGLSDIRKGAVPVETTISEKTSPIGLSAKSGVVEDLKSRAKAGLNTATPSYVVNPESVAYATEPGAKINRASMKVRYNPATPGAKTGLEGKLARLQRVREAIQAPPETPATPALPAVSTAPRVPPTTNKVKPPKGVSPDIYKQLLDQQLKPTEVPVDQARSLLGSTLKQPSAEPSIQSPPLAPKAPPAAALPKSPKPPKAKAPSTAQLLREKEQLARQARAGGRPGIRIGIPNVKNILSGTDDTYEGFLKRQAARDAAETTVAKTAKAVDSNINLPSLNSARQFIEDRPGLAKIGAGALGAGAILAGGNLIAENLAQQRQEAEMRRQQLMYNYTPDYYQQ